ncbi:MAG TPA: flagellar filament capping protein FliD, partial [Tepidisphaeraceae bacterium]
DGTSADVDLGSAVTMGDALDAINTAAGTKGVATLAPGGKGLTLTDNTTGGGTLTVAAIDGSTAFKDLGLDAAVNGKQIDGSALQSKLGTVLLKTLNGGAGIKLGTISVTNRQGAATSIDLSQAQTLQTAIESINGANAGIKAAVNASGNGLALTDTTGGTGNLVIGDVSGTGAAQLGLAGTFTAAQATVRGANLQRKWVSENTALASYNGGKGVAVGEMKISAGNGESRVIKIDPATDLRMGDVIKKINTAFNGKVVASVNTTGDGLLLTDATGGAGTLKVDEVNSTTAADLGLDAKATGTTLDGTREKKITIDADDTLADVQTKINDLSHGLGASIINDGSGSAPFRLSLNARNSGMAGRMVFDAGATSLSTRTLVEAQDAAVFVGTAGGAQPLLITASRNQISGVIKGVNIDLHGVSSAPVTVNVTRDIGNVGETMQSFVDSFNELIGKVDEYTKFDSATMERGILLGDPSITQVENELYGMLSVVVPQAGKFRILADVGLRVGEGGKLEFDQEKFNSAYAEDPESVEELFTNAGSAIASSTKTSLLNRGSGVQTAGDGKKDFKATLRDGSTVEVGIGEVANLGQIISAINAASPAKLRAEITEDGRVNLTDLTAGVKTFALEQINASQFIYDLGLTATQKDGIIVGRQLKVENSLEAVTGGIGVTMQQKLNKLIDPVNGLITRQSKTLTARTDQYKDRIEDLGKLLDAKRFRLEKQFANLESSLSQLQNQQSSLGSIQSLNNNNNNR